MHKTLTHAWSCCSLPGKTGQIGKWSNHLDGKSSQIFKLVENKLVQIEKTDYYQALKARIRSRLTFNL
jgi:hypothetical protein